VAPGGGASGPGGVDRRRGRGRADRAARARAAEREPAGRAIRNRPLGDEGSAATEVEAAAGEVLDEGIAAVQRGATGATGRAGAEVEQRRGSTRQGGGRRAADGRRGRADGGRRRGRAGRRRGRAGRGGGRRPRRCAERGMPGGGELLTGPGSVGERD